MSSALLSSLLSLAVIAGLTSACLPIKGSPTYTLGKASVQAAQQGLSSSEERFMKVPSNQSAYDTLKYLTAAPHMAGTPGDHDLAVYVQQKLIQLGISDAVIDPQRVTLSYPLHRSLDLTHPDGTVAASARLAEDILPSDPTSDTVWRNRTFAGYSPSGNVTGRVVYANYGLPEDFAALKAMNVSLEGAVVLMRYGKCFRGLKAMNAQAEGAVGALLYSDPQDDGYAKGEAYPNGPWRPKTGVQRGSTQFISVCAGDPTRAYSPHGRSVQDVCGKSTMELIPHIPVLPISWGDALLFFDHLKGSEAPFEFRGALNLTYRTGPSAMVADLRVANKFVVGEVSNVIGTIPGTLPEAQDQPVLLGNHRDAWVFGAADPNSGTAALLEVAKGLGALLGTGWRPERTIVLCSWSGEEFGLLGSTAWGEVHGDGADGAVSSSGLLARAAAYLNVDVGVSGTQFGASGTATLGSVLAGALSQVADPLTGRKLSEEWAEGELGVLGSGSDYTVFVDHLGIPSLDLHFSPGSTYGTYHSVYDSFEWMVSEGDPGFHYHVAMAQLWGLITLRLAGEALEGAPRLLPLNITLQADAISRAIHEAKHLATNSSVDFSTLEQASGQFSLVAAAVMKAAGSSQDPSALNQKLGLLERQFLSSEGLPGRKWFRHFLQAPGLYTGYAPQNLPGIEHALQSGDAAEAQQQIQVARDRIDAAVEFLKA